MHLLAVERVAMMELRARATAAPLLAAACIVIVIRILVFFIGAASATC
jgi:hypothetical protein